MVIYFQDKFLWLKMNIVAFTKWNQLEIIQSLKSHKISYYLLDSKFSCFMEFKYARLTSKFSTMATPPMSANWLDELKLSADIPLIRATSVNFYLSNQQAEKIKFMPLLARKHNYLTNFTLKLEIGFTFVFELFMVTTFWSHHPQPCLSLGI